MCDDRVTMDTLFQDDSGTLERVYLTGQYPVNPSPTESVGEGDRLKWGYVSPCLLETSTVLPRRSVCTLGRQIQSGPETT